jgi:hypothetical protein
MRWDRKVLGVFSRRSSFKMAGSREQGDESKKIPESDVGDKRHPEKPLDWIFAG